MAERLTRDELYRLVWAQPMSLLAPRFGISDVALKKTCAKADIPVPERGYWAKRQAGKKTIQVPLPPRAPGMDEEIVVGGGGTYWHRGLTEQEILGPLPEPPLFSEPIEVVRESARKRIGKVAVPKAITAAHPVISKLLQEDERRREKQRSSTFSFSWDAPVFDSPFERRRLRILNSLFLALARIGAKAWTRGREAKEIGITVGHQHVGVTLDRLPSSRRGGRHSALERDKPSDQLRFVILIGLGTERERLAWQDDEKGAVEDRLGDIAAEIVVAAELQHREARIRGHEWRVERKAQLEEEVRKRKIEAERKERERQLKLEQERIERLLSEAASLQRATEIRAYVDAVRAAVTSTGTINPEQMERWSAWALAQADRIDPIKSGAFLIRTADDDA